MKTEKNYTIESIFGLTNKNRTPEWNSLICHEEKTFTTGDRIIGEIANIIVSKIAGSNTLRIQTI